MEAGLHFLDVRYNINMSEFDTGTVSHKGTTHNFDFGFNSARALSVTNLTIGVIYKFGGGS
jgi:hypothetical protein